MTTKGSRKKHFLVIVASLVALGLATLLGYYFFYIPYLEAQETSTKTTMMLMDTVVNVRADGRNSAELVSKVFATMSELEETLSRFIDTSDVHAVNRQAGEWVKVSPHTLKVVELGIEMGKLTGGTFDITIGAVLDLWGFGSGRHRVPTEEELSMALATVDYSKIEVDQAGSRIRIPKGTILDLGGIAKGYIIDQGTDIFRQGKVQRSIVDAGGDISVIGQRPDGHPWRVGVQDPIRPSEIRWILPLDNKSVVTSGDYQRFFVQDGVRYHHIIDPRSGYPAQGLHSVTIVGPDAATCDALSTAVFVLGLEEGRALVESLPDVEGILVSDNETWISPGLVSLVATP